MQCICLHVDDLQLRLLVLARYGKERGTVGPDACDAGGRLLLRLLDFGDPLTFHVDGQLTSGFYLLRVTHQQRLLKMKGKKQ